MTGKTEDRLRETSEHTPLKTCYVGILNDCQNFVVTWEITDYNIKRKGEDNLII